MNSQIEPSSSSRSVHVSPASQSDVQVLRLVDEDVVVLPAEGRDRIKERVRKDVRPELRRRVILVLRKRDLGAVRQAGAQTVKREEVQTVDLRSSPADGGAAPC